MIGTFNSEFSWEKQQVFDLDNGWTATVEHGHYGSHISRLDNPEKNWYWHCSSGIGELPEFAREWLRGGEWFITQNLVDPNFQREFI